MLHINNDHFAVRVNCIQKVCRNRDVARCHCACKTGTPEKIFRLLLASLQKRPVHKRAFPSRLYLDFALHRLLEVYANDGG